MGRADYYASGDHNAVCYECGRKRKASQLKKHWQGYYVCPEHWEPRQPQDFVRSVPDVQTPPWAQPMPADTFAATVWQESLADSVTLQGGNAASTYIAPTYIDVSYFEAIPAVLELVIVASWVKSLADTVTATMAGTATREVTVYIDPTYFIDTPDYIGDPAVVVTF